MATKKESEKKKEEIERLKKRIEKLEKEVGESTREETSEKKESSLEKTSEKKDYEKKKFVWILVILVIIILIVDIISLIAYYKPDFLNFNKSKNAVKTKDISSGNNLSGKKCIDGTLSGSCSKDKPLFCYNGELLKNARICGCPDGYKLDFQSCVKI